jgi:chorismate dehydratase
MEFNAGPSPLGIGYTPAPTAEVLTWALHQVTHLQLLPLPYDELRAHWRDGALTCALLAPLDYLHHGHGKLIPGLGVFASGPSHTEFLYFRGEPAAIQRLACLPPAQPVAAMAQLLLAEAYGVTPAIEQIPLEALRTQDFDGCITSGFEFLLAEHPYPHRIDLASLWRDITSHPFPLAVWAGAPRAPYAELRRRLARACQLGLAAIDAIGEESDAAHRLPRGAAANHLRNALRFAMGAQDADALRVLLQLATRHHLADNTAAIRFC